MSKYEDRILSLNKPPLTLKEYLQASLDSTPDKDLCRGWDYIKANIISELADIIILPEYLTIVYNSENVESILKKLNITDISQDLKRQLGSFVYIYKDMRHDTQREEYEAAMIAQGWIRLTPEIVKQAFDTDKKLQVNASSTHDWLTIDRSNTYRPIVNSAGVCYLMKPRARTKGLTLSQFENAFCKIVAA